MHWASDMCGICVASIVVRWGQIGECEICTAFVCYGSPGWLGPIKDSEGDICLTGPGLLEQDVPQQYAPITEKRPRPNRGTLCKCMWGSGT